MNEEDRELLMLLGSVGIRPLHPGHGRGLSRTPKVASARSTPGGVQVAAAPGLLRDEEAVGSNPATPTVIKICPLWSE